MAGKDYVKTLTSFSGSDLMVNFGPKAIGELQQISWGIKREKAPVFTLGSSDARSFSRGKRGIGGSLVMAQFNRDTLMAELVEDPDVWKSIAPTAMFTAAGNLVERGNEVFAYALEASGWNKRANATQNAAITQGGGGAIAGANTGVYGMSGGNFDQEGNWIGGDGGGFGYSGFQTNNVSGKTENNPNWVVTPGQALGTDRQTIVNVPTGFGVIQNQNIIYADMIPPFDVTMTFANEYGQAAFQKIYDLEILDEQSGVSVDSIVMERAMSWIARRISSLTSGVYSRSSDGVFKGVEVVKKEQPSTSKAANRPQGALVDPPARGSYQYPEGSRVVEHEAVNGVTPPNTVVDKDGNTLGLQSDYLVK